MWTYRLHVDAGLDFPNDYEWHSDGKSDPTSPRGRICDELGALAAKLPKYSVGDKDFHGDCHLHGVDDILHHTPTNFLVGNYRNVIVAHIHHLFYSHQNPSLPASSHIDNDPD
jgi:hypothetical protein